MFTVIYSFCWCKALTDMQTMTSSAVKS